MAIPYPRGECYFDRDALVSETPGNFDAENPLHFYSHFLVEVIWNKEAHSGDMIPQEDHRDRTHPRSDYKVAGEYGWWTDLSVTYGKYGKGNATRRATHPLCSDESEFKETYKSWFLVFPMPKAGEDWVFIDRVAHIRGVYLPVSRTTSPEYEDLCSYVQVNFSHRDYPKMMNYLVNADGKVEKSMKEVYCDMETGLATDGSTTLGLNVHALITALLIPRRMRKRTIFEAGEAIIIQSNKIDTANVTHTNTKDSAIDFIKVESANRGLHLTYQEKPAAGNSVYLEALALNFSFYIGFVPTIGPALSFASSLVSAILLNPDNALNEVMKHFPSALMGKVFKDAMENDILVVKSRAQNEADSGNDDSDTIQNALNKAEAPNSESGDNGDDGSEKPQIDDHYIDENGNSSIYHGQEDVDKRPEIEKMLSDDELNWR